MATNLKLNKFKSRMKGGVKSNLFRVTLNFPSAVGGDTELTTFMIKAASLPGSNMETLVVPFRGKEAKIASGDRTFEPYTMTIWNDPDFSIRNAIERWMDLMSPHVLQDGEEDPTEYESDITIEQLNRNDEVIKTYTLIDGFPEVLGEIEVSDENKELEQYDVTFAYTYWDSDTIRK